MLIDKIKFVKLDLCLRKPYTIAYETISEATNFILKISTRSGMCGYGCAAPDLAVTHEDPAMVEKAITTVVIPYLEGKNPYCRGEILEHFRKVLPNHNSTLAMIDMALFDLLARRTNLPLYQVLGGYRHSIPTSVTIGILPTDETLEEAAEIISKGFFILKVKGGLDIDNDIERIRKIREQFGPVIRIRFDGNQGFDLDETVRFIKEAHPYNVEILEQPMAIGSELPNFDEGNNGTLPIMADESLKHLKDAFRIAKNSAIDMINIKIQKVGGLEEAMHINSVSKAVNNEVMIGCLDECALGISSGLHLALSRPNIQFADLDAHLDFENDPFQNLFTIKEGLMYPKLQPGLGKISAEINDMFIT
ncbi:mandelate racemase/muconate lactonizing enzyme family protein [Portibacter lacus]|uniref:Dipeptide epimerase n=1 Tax=Portibacter lacus TaxID=1099794 RepID=A0AA37SKK2_9BACT|nr:dipeptide epimerase [Portibacter lacus]GLR15595.1 dipeptide epimerase [Portibacter lacus]